MGPILCAFLKFHYLGELVKCFGYPHFLQQILSCHAHRSTVYMICEMMCYICSHMPRSRWRNQLLYQGSSQCEARRVCFMLNGKQIVHNAHRAWYHNCLKCPLPLICIGNDAPSCTLEHRAQNTPVQLCTRTSKHGAHDGPGSRTSRVKSRYCSYLVRRHVWPRIPPTQDIFTCPTMRTRRTKEAEWYTTSSRRTVPHCRPLRLGRRGRAALVNTSPSLPRRYSRPLKSRAAPDNSRTERPPPEASESPSPRRDQTSRLETRRAA